MTSFLGLDLAWHSSGHTTALAYLRGNGDEVTIQEVAPALVSDSEILAAISASAETDTVLAIDAPLIIHNATGQRPCETAVSRQFGHAHAGAHTSNLSLFPSARSVSLAQELQGQGWHHHVDPDRDRRRPGKWLFEVYPHPAHLVLFDLYRIIKYKKGILAQRREGLRTYRRAILKELGLASPRLIVPPPSILIFEQDLDGLGGAYLKSYEDMLDAIVCAYMAAHYWTWGGQRNQMIGTMANGYIVVPTKTATGKVWQGARTPCHLTTA